MPEGFASDQAGAATSLGASKLAQRVLFYNFASTLDRRPSDGIDSTLKYECSYDTGAPQNLPDDLGEPPL